MTQTIKGMQDFLPERARKKKYIENICREVFVSYGFKPMETPALEYLETLTKKGGAGEAIVEEIYAFKDKAERDVGLRFDLTVPLARVVAANSTSMSLPFKRYAIERVYRYDKPGEKRYREFTQADVDIIGSSSLLCELECLGIAVQICQKLKIDFEVVVNSRKLLESLAVACGIEKGKVNDCFRSIDKLDKIGKTGVEKELNEKGLNANILKWCAEKELSIVKKFLKEKKANLDGVQELEQFMDLAKEISLEKFVCLDFSLARGLGYYTGLVFEVKVKQGPSIGGGGRYDQLISILGGQDLKACGISFGIDRILDTIESKLSL
ncbi:MAG: histidine--tRNA ligase, partial [Candidatus Diapherotrites archaeon]|nr:histidine--tRNA ligase [Candidatus Diapherotrites archaeon]